MGDRTGQLGELRKGGPLKCLKCPPTGATIWAPPTGLFTEIPSLNLFFLPRESPLVGRLDCILSRKKNDPINSHEGGRDLQMDPCEPQDVGKPRKTPWFLPLSGIGGLHPTKGSEERLF